MSAGRSTVDPTTVNGFIERYGADGLVWAIQRRMVEGSARDGFWPAGIDAALSDVLGPQPFLANHTRWLVAELRRRGWTEGRWPTISGVAAHGWKAPDMLVDFLRHEVTALPPDSARPELREVEELALRCPICGVIVSRYSTANLDRHLELQHAEDRRRSTPQSAPGTWAVVNELLAVLAAFNAGLRETPGATALEIGNRLHLGRATAKSRADYGVRCGLLERMGKPFMYVVVSRRLAMYQGQGSLI